MRTKVANQLSVSVSTGWLHAFAGHLVEGGKSERTIQAYLQDVRSFCAWFDAENEREFSPGELTGWDVRGYKKFLQGEKRAAATVNRRLATLRALAGWAVDEGLLAVDPTEKIQGMASQALAPRWLTRAEFGRLMRQAEREVNAATSEFARLQARRDRLAVCLMAYAGLRVSEVCALETGDVQLSERKCIIRVLGKGEKERYVPLPGEGREALRDWLNESGIELGGEARSLWAGKLGEGWSSRAVQRAVKELGRLAGVDGATPHRLRHTGAKRMVEAGVDVTVVAAVLGHERIETTRRYTLPGMEDLEEAVERI